MATLTQRARMKLPLGLRKFVKVSRLRAFEAAGSGRYSDPAVFDVGGLVSHYGLPDRGVFLEVGANDGYSQSNTFRLERNGWTGILIEPDPRNFARCVKMRPAAHCVDVACVEPGAEYRPVELSPDDLGAKTNTQHTQRRGRRRPVLVRGATISSVIDASPFDHVDFMSVDVEGSEMQLLAGLDLERHAPELLLIETDRLSDVDNAVRPHLELREQVSPRDYVFTRRRSTSTGPTR